MRLPSNGMGFPSGFMRGSAITLSQAALRASFDGQTIHENTTVSSSLRWTAIGNDVILPSGTSSPQHSTTLSADVQRRRYQKMETMAESARRVGSLSPSLT